MLTILKQTNKTERNFNFKYFGIFGKTENLKDFKVDKVWKIKGIALTTGKDFREKTVVFKGLNVRKIV